MVADKLRELAEAGVTRVRVHYTDLIGTTRAKVIPLDVLEEACDDGLNFCVSVFAIDHTGVMPDGTGIRDEVNFRDMQVVADLETLRIVPWERETAICLADCRLDGEPLEADPRNILRRAIAAAEAKGLNISVGHELEFFLLRRTPEGRLLPYQPTPGSSTAWTSAPTRRASSGRWRTTCAGSASRSSASTTSTTPRSGRSTPATRTP